MVQPSGARWRSWLLAIISGLGVLAAFGVGMLLLFSGVIGLVGDQIPAPQSVSVLNLAWESVLVALLCVPALILSIRELTGHVDVDHTPRRSFIFATLTLLPWIGLVFLFKPVETSQLVWLFLPPLGILATIIPLWWFLESGRRRLPSGPSGRIWGVVCFSFVVSIPFILVIELVLLVGILIAFGVYAGTQPDLMQQLEHYGQLFSNFAYNSAVIQDLIGQLLQKPGVVVAVLVVTAGIIPLIEELFKPLAVWLFAGDRLTPSQGFIAGIFCGASFALYENLTVLSSAVSGGGTEILLGRVGTGLLHVVTAGLVSWGMASFWQNRRYFGRLIGAYLLAVFLHGFWNAAGVISGFAPLMPIAGQTPALITGLGNAATGTLYVLFGVNLFLLFFVNLRLRRENSISTDLPGAGNSRIDPISMP